MLLCFGEPPVRFLWCCCSSFHFWSSFCCCSSFCYCSSFVDVLHSHFFSAPSFTFSWTIAGFLHPFHTFSPAHRRVICDSFIFWPFCYLLTANATVLRGHFLPTDVFYLTLLQRHFTSLYQGFPGSRQFFLKFAGLHTDPLKTDLANLFVWLTVIHNLQI